MLHFRDAFDHRRTEPEEPSDLDEVIAAIGDAEDLVSTLVEALLSDACRPPVTACIKMAISELESEIAILDGRRRDLDGTTAAERRAEAAE